MLVAVAIAPTLVEGEDASMSHIVAQAVRVIEASGLPYDVGPMFTTIEGEWEEIMATVKKATDAVSAFSPRVSVVLKADIRQPGADGKPRSGEITGKTKRLATQLAMLDAETAEA